MSPTPLILSLPEYPLLAYSAQDSMAEVRLTLEEYEALRRLITSERESEGVIEEERTSRKRKKTKNDRLMSRAMKDARARATKKNGNFRKGWNQSRMMKYAHSLRRKML